MYITLPNRQGSDYNFESFDIVNPLVIIGANGSGKSRLGAWIDQANPSLPIHRISAHRALSMSEYTPLRNLEQATKKLLWGSEVHGSPENKHAYKWDGKPATLMQNDYDDVLSALFAISSKRDNDYVKLCREDTTNIKPPLPESAIEILTNIWKDILPHRTILLEDNKVKVISTDGTYHGKEMSDGERVCLYLVGQCLSTPPNSIIIIDEPEIHLHKSLMNRLWNKIEEVRADCKFIYITHDLDFASSRINASKIWVKSYKNGNLWNWDIIPEIDEIPESLVLEVAGSRKNILFCEGEKGSLDVLVYQLAYPDYYVLPRGGGDKVIEAVKGFRSNSQLHHVQSFGIIDSDYKEEEEKLALKGHGIYTISVAEIESLFCTEAILRVIANHLCLDADTTVDRVIDYIVTSLSGEIEVQISSKVEKIIQYKLNNFSKTDHSESGLSIGLQNTISAINVSDLYNNTRTSYEEAIKDKDLEKLLLIYNRKSLPDRISDIFGLKKGEYIKLLTRLINGEKRQEIIDSLRKYLPPL